MANKKIKNETADVLALQTIKLLKPKLDKGKSLLKALENRKTIREVSDKKLSLQQLSNLLWAACGINRKKGHSGYRVVPLHQQATLRKLMCM
jgi:hypothetical protein